MFDKEEINQKFLTRHSTDFNEETRLAMREARLISEGKIPSKTFHSVRDLLKDLNNNVDD